MTIPQELVDIAARVHEVVSSDFSEPPPDPMRAALDAYEAALWQPIETAPRDYTDVLLWNGDHYLVSFWMEQRQCWHGTSRALPPTHWCPVPAGPEASP